MTFWIRDWLAAFVLTLGIELLVAFLLLSHEPSRARRVAALLLVNLATHPIVWFVCPALRLPAAARFAIAELFAMATEAWAFTVIWPKLPRSKACLVALVANSASATTGVLLRGF